MVACHSIIYWKQVTSPSPSVFLSCSLGKEKEIGALFCNWWWLLAFGMHFFQMVHNDSGKSQLTLPLLSWPEEGATRPCTFPEMHPDDMKRCLLGHRAFVLQAPLHLPQGRAEESLVHLPLLRDMALPPTRSRENLVSRCPMGTAELEIPGHNGVTQDRCNWDLAELPPGGPCFRLDGVSRSWARVPTPLQLPHKQASGPRWPAQGAEQTSSRLQIPTERLGRGEQTPTQLLLPALDPEVPQDQLPVQV